MLLAVDDVSFHFGGVLANQDVSLTVAEGEILGLIGPNGAGKTTLFNIIAGALRPSEGRIRFCGEDITGRGPNVCCERGIARTFQVVKSFEAMTVIENVMIGAFCRTGRERVARGVAREVIEWTGLDGRRDALAAELTPPEKRRLEVARALATRPKLLLLDEVLAGLTPTEAQAGVKLVRDIHARGISVLMVEHVMEVLMPLVDRVVVLNLGKLLAEGRPIDIVRNEDVIAAYLGEKFRARA
ncbi:MAG TPA: ABC transporter ATP-binding protein [Alphaproteobacteria bacterium]|nr:ABC transporter ATP-binding protein [Alphaproteobacteria bacterium]